MFLSNELSEPHRCGYRDRLESGRLWVWGPGLVKPPSTINI